MISNYALDQVNNKAGCTLNEFYDIWYQIQEQPAWRARADREADYYDGNQLDAEILQAQREKGIPPSIENLIGRTIDDIVGMEAKTRTDWKVVPESGVAEDDVALAMSIKLSKAERESGANVACSQVYEAMVKVGIGWIEVARNSDPFQYPYRVQYVHRNEIWWDMKSKAYDLSDAMWLVRRRWVHASIAMLMFPKHKELIKLLVNGAETGDLAAMVLEGGDDTGLGESIDIDRGWTIEESEWRDVHANRVCLFEVYNRRFRKTMVIRTPDGRITEFDKDNPAHQLACLCGYEPEPVIISDIWQSYFCGPHKLGERKIEFRKGRFPYIPFIYKREDRTGVPYGIVRGMMYLQDEINARISKMQWLLSATRTERTENAVAMSDEAFRQTIGRPDADIILNKSEMNTGGIFRVERDATLNQQQYERLIDLRNSIQAVSGVTEAFQGRGGSETASGLQALIEQSIQSLARANDAYNRARMLVGEMLLQLIIEDSADEEQVIVPGGLVKDDRVVVINTSAIDHDTGIEYRNNDVQRAMLKVALSDVPTTPSFRQHQLQALSEAFKAAPPQFQAVMMPHLMSLMDVPHKEEIIKAVREIANGPDVDAAVEQALAESNRDLKEKELQLKAMKTDAEVKKIVSEAVSKAVQGMYSAMQAAGVIAATPETAPLADQLLRSAGFKDQDEAPLVPGMDTVQPGSNTVAEMTGTNTSPAMPAPPETGAPPQVAGTPADLGSGSAAEGANQGIETPEIEGR